MSTSSVPGRLRWRCRRGMLELDLLLERFLERGYAELDREGQAAFLRLLELPDSSLQGWLLGESIPTDRDVRRIVDLVRRCPTAD